MPRIPARWARKGATRAAIRLINSGRAEAYQDAAATVRACNVPNLDPRTAFILETIAQEFNSRAGIVEGWGGDSAE